MNSHLQEPICIGAGYMPIFALSWAAAESGGGCEDTGTQAGVIRQGDKVGIHVVLPGFVGQRPALLVQHLSAGPLDHGLGRSGIPLRGGRQAWIEVDPAFGQPAELERTAGADQLQW